MTSLIALSPGVRIYRALPIACAIRLIRLKFPRADLLRFHIARWLRRRKKVDRTQRPAKCAPWSRRRRSHCWEPSRRHGTIRAGAESAAERSCFPTAQRHARQRIASRRSRHVESTHIGRMAHRAMRPPAHGYAQSRDLPAGRSPARAHHRLHDAALDDETDQWRMSTREATQSKRSVRCVRPIRCKNDFIVGAP